jgi:AmiR/NasT family two-component response regulator
LLTLTKHLSEARAYQQLQQYAMTKQRRLAEVADIVIATLQK